MEEYFVDAVVLGDVWYSQRDVIEVTVNVTQPRCGQHGAPPSQGHGD